MIKLSFEFRNVQEAADFLAMHGGVTAPKVLPPPAPAEKPAVEAEPVPAKPKGKRGRKPKAAAVAPEPIAIEVDEDDEEDGGPALPSDEETKEASDTSEPEAAATVSVASMRAAAIEFSQKYGQDKFLVILKKFTKSDEPRLSMVPPAKYGDLQAVLLAASK